MLDVFRFLISSLSKVVNWVFSVTIIESPKITLGSFILACSLIGIVIFILFSSGILPNFGDLILNSDSSRSKDNYRPRHSIGNGGKDFSTRESRHKY